MPLFKYLGNYVKVFCKFPVSVFLYEFAALPEFNLDEFCQFLVLFHQAQVKKGKVMELVPGVIILGYFLLDPGNDLAHLFFKNGNKNVVFVVEIEINGAVCNIGFLCDLCNSGIEEAVSGKNSYGCLDNPSVFISYFHQFFTFDRRAEVNKYSFRYYILTLFVKRKCSQMTTLACNILFFQKKYFNVPFFRLLIYE